MKKTLTTISIFAGVVLLSSCSEDDPVPENPANMPYEVAIDPADFVSTNITGNDLFPLVSGITMIYEGVSDEGEPVRVEVERTGDTKTIMGVTCVVVRDKEYVNDELVEDTYDWYAQDNEGNVWYFGEDTKEMEDGTVVSTEGSWEAGVDGALPGIIMLEHPLTGIWYRQEYFKGEAEDVAQILSLSATVTVPFGGTYNNCVEIAEWNLLEPGVIEHKFYAPGVGLIRVEAVQGSSEYEDLVEIN
jgi:hypothetical protein